MPPPPFQLNAASHNSPASSLGHAPVQRLTGRVEGLQNEVETIFKRAKALLITSKATDEGLQGGKVNGYQENIAFVEQKLKGFIARDAIVEDNSPQMNPMLEGQPLFIAQDVIHVTADYLEMPDKARQATMLMDLLSLGQVVDQPLYDFMDEADMELEDHERLSLTSGTHLYRVLNASSAYKYISDGISRVSNREGWTELGKGFYTSPDFEGAEAYAPTVGRPAAVIKMQLTNSADGMVFHNTGELDGKSEAQIEETFGVEDFAADHHLSQIKFHNPFYRENLDIVEIKVMEGPQNWVTYTPATFVDAYRNHLIDRHKDKAEDVAPDLVPQAPPMNVAELPRANANLRNAPDASEEDMAAIRYAAAAEAFELRLGNYLAKYGPALAQVTRLVQTAWDKVEEGQRKKFGTRNSVNTGMVGDDLISLRGVVEGGNLREKFTFLYNGYVNNIFGRLERPAEFQAERRDREARPEEDGATVATPHPDLLDLPLSDREWFGAVDAQGQLGWQPGAAKYHYKMESDFQQLAQRMLAPVATGTSGTAFGILQMADLLKGDTAVNLELVRLGLLGWMIPARDHTFHEIMTACNMFSDTLAYNPSLDRYKHLAPLDTELLRQQVAENGVFPDEL